MIKNIKFQCKDKKLGHIYNEKMTMTQFNEFIRLPINKNFEYNIQRIY